MPIIPQTQVLVLIPSNDTNPTTRPSKWVHIYWYVLNLFTLLKHIPSVQVRVWKINEAVLPHVLQNLCNLYLRIESQPKPYYAPARKMGSNKRFISSPSSSSRFKFKTLPAREELWTGFERENWRNRGCERGILTIFRKMFNCIKPHYNPSPFEIFFLHTRGPRAKRNKSAPLYLIHVIVIG